MSVLIRLIYVVVFLLIGVGIFMREMATPSVVGVQDTTQVSVFRDGDVYQGYKISLVKHPSIGEDLAVFRGAWADRYALFTGQALPSGGIIETRLYGPKDEWVVLVYH
jgi:hypothetical protein